MDITQLRRIRKILGLISSALLFTTLACLADSLREGFMDAGREFQAAPGETILLTSPLPPGAAAIEDMRISGGDPTAALVADGLYTGFWLGGAMWKGRLVVQPDAKPGERVFVIEGPATERPKTGPANISIKLTVFEDALAKQQASPSFITRNFGIPPYAATLGALILALPFAGAGFFVSRRVEQLLTLEGKGLVYMVKQSEEGTVIGFSLGSKQGLSPGSLVGLIDKAGQHSGQARVKACLPGDATAEVVSGSCVLGDMAVLQPGDASRPDAASPSQSR